jgi:hypothetical protein
LFIVFLAAKYLLIFLLALSIFWFTISTSFLGETYYLFWIWLTVYVLSVPLIISFKIDSYLVNSCSSWTVIAWILLIPPPSSYSSGITTSAKFWGWRFLWLELLKS